MGCVQSTSAVDEAKPRHVKIEEEPKKVEKPEIKMLLLGAGESGKSTILKQMKIIHQGKYTDWQRTTYTEIIFYNTIQSMNAILEELPNLGLTIASENDAHRAFISSIRFGIAAEILPRNVVDAISSLCQDAAVKEAIRRSGKFQLHDSAVYYFNSVHRMSLPSYIPTEQDILRSNVTTTGITETVFTVGELRYRLFDVGGQRSERKKWIHCFADVTAVIFVVGLSEYDQVLFEDASANRMQDSLRLFDSVCNSRWFTNTPMILFLNKIDLFSEKLLCSPLSDYFPDYCGANDDYDAACDYLLHRFVSLNQSAATKQIFAHYTCATDTNQLKFVLDSIQDILLQRYLRECRTL